jgi:alkyl sulfatase BDS1-like metallo-beta-lactamase superfamily hydrolase
MKFQKHNSLMLIAVLTVMLSWGRVVHAADVQPNNATEATKATNATILQELPFSNTQDFKDAKRGFIAPLPDGGVIKNAKGQPVWDLTKFSFIKEGEKAPDTVNPSLWRQSQLIMMDGLFKVTDHIYQVRNADLSNLTIIEGKKGITIADPLVSAETAKAALDLYYQHRPKKPVLAVIYSHSHVDHFGGVRGVVDEKDVKAGKVRIFAPAGFMEHAVAENVFAGNAMSRRASYMYGNILPKSPTGQVGAGLGVTTSFGQVTLIPPTDIIEKTGQKFEIDGLTYVFLYAPNTEAPSEMHWFIPEYKAITAAENCNHTLHNLYSLRGAKVRDAKLWAKALNETLELWGDKADVLYGMHHWPTWGREKVAEHMKKQRDVYKYIHDQTLNLANHGYTMFEIAEMLELPDSLANHWASRGYYGSVNHDIKAVYNFYLGFYDGNPATLNQLPPAEAGKKYVEFMGGASAVIKQAKKSYAAGDYRWVAQVMNHVVFADPDNAEAKKLQADALEQLGYIAESGPWRNFYLSGAKELRNGVVDAGTPDTASPDIISSMSLDMVFDFMGVRLNGKKAAGKKIAINLDFTDTKQQYVITLDNSVINYVSDKQAKDVDATFTLKREVLNSLMLKQTTLDKAIASGDIKVDGDKQKLVDLLAMLDTFEFWFNIVTP